MTNSSVHPRVAVIGLGNMGSGLAEALVSAGVALMVWNRSPGKSQPLADRGATVATSPADAAASSDVTIVCVSDHDAFVEIIHDDAVADALAGKDLIQLGVVTAEQAQQTGNWAQSRDIGYIEGSILGLPDNVRNASALLVCSGPKNRFDRYLNLLSIFGSAQLVSEAIGSAYNFDKVYYSFAYAVVQGFIQGAALAHASRFSIDAYTGIVLKRLPVVMDNLGRIGDRIRERDHDGDEATIEVWADAYAKSRDLCRSLDVDDTLPAALMDNFDKAIAAGYGNKEITAIVEVLLPSRAE